MTSNGGVVPRDIEVPNGAVNSDDVVTGSAVTGSAVTGSAVTGSAGTGDSGLSADVDIPSQRSAPSSTELADARRLAGYLTARERECLELIVEGLGTDAMAKRLGVSNTTVRTHSQRLLTKLGVHSRLEAASFAVRHSLLDRPPQG